MKRWLMEPGPPVEAALDGERSRTVESSKTPRRDMGLILLLGRIVRVLVCSGILQEMWTRA